MASKAKGSALRLFLAFMGSVALAASLVALGGCSTASEQTEGTAAAGASGNAVDESAESAAATTQGDAAQGETTASSNILVAYFSGTGNTQRVAEIAADELGADLFEIVPAEPYTEADLDYNDETSRVSIEHDQGLTEVELVATAPDGGLDGYDTVLIGYPIWWGSAAWPVGGFVSANDLSGKTVIPFCTSASSGAGTSGESLVGVAATRFSSSASEDEVRAWAASLIE